MRCGGAGLHAALRVEVGHRIIFGETFRIPERVGGIRMLRHQVMDIFVEQDVAAAEVEFGLAGIVLHADRNCAARAHRVEAGDAAVVFLAQRLLNRGLIGHQIDFEGDRAGGRQVQGLAQHPVESVQVGCGLVEFGVVALAVDGELAGFGRAPFGARGACRGQQDCAERQKPARHQRIPPREAKS
jgi:hypothetical protein